jgi:hypothetical protein
MNRNKLSSGLLVAIGMCFILAGNAFAGIRHNVEGKGLFLQGNISSARNVRM